MSIRISSKVCLVGALVLAGCVAGYGPGRVKPILGGEVRVGMAAGYCIAENAGRESEDRAVVLMGRCSSAVEAVPAVLTLSVGTEGSGSVLANGSLAMARFFTSAEGRKSLSRSGRASQVRVLEARGDGDMLLLRVRDRAVGEYWRAVTVLNGRLVTLSVAGTDDAPLDADQGRAVLDAALAALLAANP